MSDLLFIRLNDDEDVKVVVNVEQICSIRATSDGGATEILCPGSTITINVLLVNFLDMLREHIKDSYRIRYENNFKSEKYRMDSLEHTLKDILGKL